MLLKTNLHFHCKDDPRDGLDYSFEASLDAAQKLGFGALALTCHDKFIGSAEYARMAKTRGILFISGIEKTIEGAHVVVLNCDADIEHVDTMAALVRYRAEHPDIFVLAAHPYFPVGPCLREKLAVYRDAFDAVEWSWFWTPNIDFNEYARAFAAEQKMPFLATSDTHELDFLDTSYAVVEVEDATIPELFAAIREQRFVSVNLPRHFFYELIPYVWRRSVLTLFKKAHI